ncbi:MAG: sigma-70 family RNA polymerase sigma factor [Planctomycetes bacterium]|nr:sigma-70 family RNA polymerase sigma factor [Planctomycetota bacterium]
MAYSRDKLQPAPRRHGRRAKIERGTRESLPDTQLLAKLVAAGESGARSFTGQRSIIREAGERTLEAFEIAVLSGKPIPNVLAWARRVGRHAAMTLAGKRRGAQLLGDGVAATDDVTTSEDSPEPASGLAELLTLAASNPALTARQRDVVRRLQGDRSLKRNAKEVGMSPYNLRRMLDSIRIRLKDG